VLTYMLFVALTNLTLGIVLGYFYGPMFWPKRQVAVAHGAAPEHAASSTAHHTEPASQSVQTTPSAAAESSISSADTAAAPAKSDANPAQADDLRPVKPTGSREVTALDLADVMSELGIEPSAPVAAETLEPVAS
jgi:predicted flap endonuclease-1-like 5' DNA nuclease